MRPDFIRNPGKEWDRSNKPKVKRDYVKLEVLQKEYAEAEEPKLELVKPAKPEKKVEKKTTKRKTKRKV